MVKETVGSSNDAVSVEVMEKLIKEAFGMTSEEIRKSSNWRFYGLPKPAFAKVFPLFKNMLNEEVGRIEGF